MGRSVYILFFVGSSIDCELDSTYLAVVMIIFIKENSSHRYFIKRKFATHSRHIIYRLLCEWCVHATPDHWQIFAWNYI